MIVPKPPNLPKTEYTGLTFENIVTDIKNKIKENPNYNKNWEDFLSANAGRMLIEMFAYIVEQLGIRVDLLINEFFLATAQQPESIINLLKLIQYQPRLSECSELEVKATVSNVYTKKIQMPYPFILRTIDLNGSPVSFELIKKNIDNKFEYPIETNNSGQVVYFDTGGYNPKTDILKFYEGTTVAESYTAKGIENELIILGNANIINNSIRLWKMTIDDNNNEIYEEGLLVDSFLNPDAQKKETFLPFKLELQDDQTYGIRFSNKSIMITKDEFNLTTNKSEIGFKEKLPVEGDEYIIYYRIGGGENGNISPRVISQSVSFFDVANQQNVNMKFINEVSGKGGKNSETLDESRINGPQYISTLNRSSSIKDNKILIDRTQYSLKSVHYSQQNNPGVSEKYGYDINPLEIWHFIVPNITGWSQRKTYEYQDIFKFTARETEIINEKHSFSIGEKNIRLALENPVDDGTKYRKSYVLSESVSQQLIDFSSGTGKILFVGNNNASLTNNESNSLALFEKLNLKITSSSVDEDTINWETISSDNYIYRDFVYEEGNFNKDNGFTLEVFNDKFVKITIQDNSPIPSFLFLHYIKPKCFYKKDDSGNYFKYIYINGYPILPNSNNDQFEIKVTSDKVNGRSILKIQEDKFLNTDYSIYRSYKGNNTRPNGYYLLTTKNINSSSISDFSYFYVHYREDYRGTSLELYTNNKLNSNNLINFANRNDYAIQVKLYLNNDDPKIVNLTNLNFSKTLTSDISQTSFPVNPSGDWNPTGGVIKGYQSIELYNSSGAINENDIAISSGSEGNYVLRINGVDYAIQTTPDMLYSELISVLSSVISEFNISFVVKTSNDSDILFENKKYGKASIVDIDSNSSLLSKINNYNSISAATNGTAGDPDLSNSSPNNNDYYNVTATGTSSFSSGDTQKDFHINDKVLYNGSEWVRFEFNDKFNLISTNKFIQQYNNGYIIKMTSGIESGKYADIIDVVNENKIKLDSIDIDINNLTKDDLFEIKIKPSGKIIQDEINLKLFDINNDMYIRSYVFSIFDEESSQIAFTTRNISVKNNSIVKIELNDVSGADNSNTIRNLSNYSLLYFNAGVSATSDKDGNGITDRYAETYEYKINSLLKNTKLTSTVDIYKQPIFKTFDLWISVYYNRSFNPLNIENNIKNSLRNRFNIINMNFNEDVYKSEILSIIHKVNGVENVTVEFFGENKEDSSGTTEENYIKSDFDEIVILSDDQYLDGFPEISDYKIHGLQIKMIRVI